LDLDLPKEAGSLIERDFSRVPFRIDPEFGVLRYRHPFIIEGKTDPTPR
jgi:hypothetical protein